MQPYITLDRQKANKAGQSDYIVGNTNPVLTIHSACWKALDRKDGGQNFALSLFVSNDNKNTTHLNIFYANSLGEVWSGENLIHAIMLCCNVPSLSQATGRHWERDFQSQTDVEVQATIAPELTGKKLGVFLTEGWYNDKNTGEPKKGSVELFNVYDAQTGQLAWQKNQNLPANAEDTQKVFDAMLVASEKSKNKAYSKAGVMPNTTQNSYTTPPHDYPQGQMQQNYAPQPTVYNGNFEPVAGMVDDNIPF